MFSGKSEELVRRLRRASYANQQVLVCTKDTRHGKGQLQTHNGREIESEYVDDAKHLLEMDLAGVAVVAIDEGQFFGDHLKDVCMELSARNIRVVVAGLDMDFEESPFENIALLLGVAEYVTKLTAICVACGEPATRTHRKVASKDRYLEGNTDTYEALCRGCYLEKTL